MRNTARIVALVGVIALAASFAVMATDRSDIVTPNLPPTVEGTMYDRTELWPLPDDGVQIPRPVAGNDGNTHDACTLRPGPVAGGGAEKLSFGGGSAIVTPRGGMVSTPQMQADREIQRLIRKLD